MTKYSVILSAAKDLEAEWRHCECRRHEAIQYNMLSLSDIKSAAAAEGFSLCGAARARVLEERRGDMERWLAQGFEGSMSWLRRGWERRLDPSFIVHGARTVIVCAVNHKNEAWNQRVSPRVASYIYAPDYHVVVKDMLTALAARLGIRARAVCDTAPILEKAWAVEAGLGWIGKNTLLITPEHGSFISLGLLVTTEECEEWRVESEVSVELGVRSEELGVSEELEVRSEECVGRHSEPPTGGVESASEASHTRNCAQDDASPCGKCTRCIDACPTGALVAPRTLDARRCIAYQTLEDTKLHSSLSTLHTQRTWLAGCDECQRACPHNQRTPLYSNPRLAPVIPAPAPAEFWHNLTRPQFDTLLGRTVLARRGYDHLKAISETV